MKTQIWAGVRTLEGSLDILVREVKDSIIDDLKAEVEGIAATGFWHTPPKQLPIFHPPASIVYIYLKMGGEYE